MSAYDTVTVGLAPLAIAVLAIVGVHGESPFHKNAVNLEAELKARAQTALNEKGLNWASVSMSGQAATVSGSAPSDEAKQLAVETVLTSTWQGGTFSGGVTSVVEAWSTAPALPTMAPYVWRAVKDERGDIFLLGAVPDEKIKSALAATASTLSETVKDRTQLALGVPAGDWASIAEFGMTQLDLLDQGEARFSDSVLSVSGVSMNDAARIQATAAVSNLSDPWQGVADIRGPSLWQAKHVDDTLVLSGSTETEDHKAEIFAIASTHFDGEVIDEMSVAQSEYRNWIEGVRAGLPHFSEFKSGEMAFAPEDEGFTFEGEASSSTLQYLREDMAAVGGEFGVAIEAEPVAIQVDELQGVDLGDDPLVACQGSFDIVMSRNDVAFETGSADISRSSGETLDKIMSVSQSCDPRFKFEVAGHTDSSGDAGANRRLSEARAQAVSNYMQATGFDPSRLLVKGYGPDNPNADNASAEGRAKNRRIEFRVQEWSE